MTIVQASAFLACSILFMLGIVVLVIGCVTINNIMHRYWKPVALFTPDSWKGFNPPPTELKEPEFDVKGLTKNG